MVQFILLPVIRIKHSILPCLWGICYISVALATILLFPYGYNSLPLSVQILETTVRFSSSANNNQNNPARTLQLVVVAGNFANSSVRMVSYTTFLESMWQIAWSTFTLTSDSKINAYMYINTYFLLVLLNSKELLVALIYHRQL